GEALKMQDRLQDAITCYDEALKIDPGYDEARQAREECLNVVRASRSDSTSARLPQDPQALGLVQMAVQLESMGNWSASARLYEQALAYEPGNPLLLLCLGNALFECERYEEAEARFREALAQDEHFGQAWLN